MEINNQGPRSVKRTSEDVRIDITRFEPFCASAARVLELDRKRNASL